MLSARNDSEGQLRQITEQFLAFHAVTLAAGSVEAYRSDLQLWLEWVGGRSARRIRRADIIEFMRWAQERGICGNVLSNRIRLIKRLFEFAVQEGACKINPVQVDRLPKIVRERPNKVAFDDAQYQRVLNVIDLGKWSPWWKSACFIAWHTGLRCSDVACLQWADVNFLDAKLTVSPLKKKNVRERLEIPLSAPMQLHLMVLSVPGKSHVLPQMRDVYCGPYRAQIPSEFRRICDQAGFPGHSFHSFRHGFVSRLVNAGVSPIIIGEMTGQSLKVIQGYAHVTMDAKRAALNLGAGGQKLHGHEVGGSPADLARAI